MYDDVMEMMEVIKRIAISDYLWDEIAKNGQFGESEDDVLRRMLGLPDAEPDEKIVLTARPSTFSMHARPERRKYLLTKEGKKSLGHGDDQTQKGAIIQLIDDLSRKYHKGVPESALMSAMRGHPVIQESRQSIRDLLRWYRSNLKDFIEVI